MKRFLLALLLVATSVQAQWPGYSFRPSGSGGASAFSDLTGSATCAQLPALTGDATTSAGSCATTLASVVSAGGPTGSATVAPIITYDAKGRLTTVSSATITPAVGDITGLGTGVATALAVNVGSAGAPVVLNGALGTPSSGTLTNATGLPAAGVVGTAAILGANTFTALQTITQASANAGILASTGYSLTGSNATGMIDLAGTWNTSGTPTALKVNVTNTASNAASLLLDLQASGASTFRVKATGDVNIGLSAGNYLYLAGSTNSGLTYDNSGIVLKRAGTEYFYFTSNFFNSATPIALGANYYTPDIYLSRSAAATLQQGAANAASPVAQTLQAQGSRSGTDTNVAGANYTMRCGAGTGAASPCSLIFQTYVPVASGTGAQTATTTLTLTNATTTATGSFILATSATPLAADACTAGRIVWGADYIYVCTASGAWKRAAITGGY